MPTPTLLSAISKQYCDQVITIPQFTGTCWFNALLMVLFYSDGMRTFFLRHLDSRSIKERKSKTRILDIVLQLLNHGYIRSERNMQMFYNKFKPETLLKELHNADAQQFYFDPDIASGHMGEMYLIRMFEYLNVKNVAYLNNMGDKGTYLSPFNNSTPVINYADGMYTWNLQSKDIVLPKKIDIVVVTNVFSESFTWLKDKYKVNSAEVGGESIRLNKVEYVLDGMMLCNFDADRCNAAHQICGVTCKLKRYIYNGWIQGTKDPAKKKDDADAKTSPCLLMKYDWINNNEGFCLSLKDCDLKKIGRNDELCFNTKKGSRTLIYVRKDIFDVRKNTPLVDCPPGKVRNPTTRRCGKPKQEKSTDCPPGKVRNPTTRRCGKPKQEKSTNSPPGKGRNPASERSKKG